MVLFFCFNVAYNLETVIGTKNDWKTSSVQTEMEMLMEGIYTLYEKYMKKLDSLYNAYMGSFWCTT